MDLPDRRSSSVATRLALAVTYAVSPLSLAPLLLGGLASASGASGRDVSLVIGWAVALVAVVPALVLAAMVRRGAVATMEVREQGRRTVPYLVGGACTLLLGLVLLGVLPGGQRLAAASALWQAVTTAVLLLINRRWKISVHLVAVAGTFATLAWARSAAHLPIPDGWLVGAALAVPLVAWARLQLRAHTPGEVLAGTVVGLLLPPLQLTLWAG